MNEVFRMWRLMWRTYPTLMPALVGAWAIVGALWIVLGWFWLRRFRLV